jgi:hypothetical protein
MASTPPQVSPPDATSLESLQNADESGVVVELDRLTLREILDGDSRPTFVLDLDPDHTVVRDHAIRPVFSNAALKLHEQLLDSVTGATDGKSTDEGQHTTTHTEFKQWVTSTSKFEKSKDIFPLTLHYQGLLWTGSTIRQRWRIISGNALYQTSDIPKSGLLGNPSTLFESHTYELNTPDPIQEIETTVTVRTNAALPPVAVQSEVASVSLSKNTSKETSGSGSSVTLATPENVVPDWTVPVPTGYISEHVKFARLVNWANTPLGPMESWSVQFREIVNLLMRNPHPASLFWGEDLTMLYNEAYKNEVAGNKHPERT